MDQCILQTMTFGGQTWSLTKQLTNKELHKKTMESKMLTIQPQDKVPYSEIIKRTKMTDIIENILKQNWKWAGHRTRMKVNRWTKRCKEGQSRRGEKTKKTSKQKVAR